MKAILICLVFSVYSCNNTEIPSIQFITSDKISFNGLECSGIQELEERIELWLNETEIKNRIIKFNPSPTSKMIHINEVKNALRGFSKRINFQVLTKAGDWKLVQYPPKISKENIPDYSKLRKRNVLNLNITPQGIFNTSTNAKYELDEIKKVCQEYISSDGSNENLPEPKKRIIQGIEIYSPTKLVITLKSEPLVNHDAYLNLYWEILEAFDDERNRISKLLIGKDYNELNKLDRKEIKRLVPIVISEIIWE